MDVFAIALLTMKILDAKYEKANFNAYFKLVNHLVSEQKISLKLLLSKYKHLFDGSMRDWKTDPVDLRLKSGEMPFQLSPFPVPKIHMETLKKEINRLCELGSFKTSSCVGVLFLRNTVLSVLYQILKY
jgi:hypothetical protein